MRRTHAPPGHRAGSALAAAWLALIALIAGAPGPAAGQNPATDSTHPELIILVRHAETAPDGSRDPALSGEGVDRARELAALLADAALTSVHTTSYRRTRGTAAPVATALALAPAEYDPRDLPAFAARLMAESGRHLVVGHSNTTPELVALLGGDPGPPIAEDEHGRIYVLHPAADGVRTLVLRY